MYNRKNKNKLRDNIPLIGNTDDESMKSGYDTFVERSEFQTTATSLLLTGPKTLFNNDHTNGHFMNGTNTRPRHRRALSFAETVDPITLTWQDVNVYAPIKGNGICGRTFDTGEVKQILKDASGIVQPGTLLAIMGASGSGKSTLLNVLTYRNRGDLIIEGSVKVNGQPLEKGIKSISAYIQQDDIFIGTLKVREHLWFQAQLRMDPEMSMNDRMLRIEEVMMEVGLSKCADTYIGVPGAVKGISGGEMKRLSFASEVLTNPPLMFCDEPTSGLDSFMAENVISTLKAMSAKGKTILCTIHQPSSEVYNLFDKLLLLAEGQTAYLGGVRNALDFFQDCSLPCPVNYNPADHFVHCLAVQPGQEFQCKERMNEIVDKYKETQECKDVLLSLREINEIQETDLLNRTNQLQSLSPYKASWWLQLRALVWRGWLGQARDVNVFAIRLLQTTIIGLIMGLVYFQTVLDERGVQNFTGALFLMITNMTFTCFYTVLNSFPLELPIFFREHHNGMYRVDAYFLSKNITEFLLFLLLPTILTLFMYWMIGFRPVATEFFLIWTVVVLVAKCAASLAYFLATSCGRIDLCLAFSPPLLLFLMLFGGYMLNIGSLPQYFQWFQWLSWFRYGFEIIMVVHWAPIYNITCTAAKTMADSLNTTATDSILLLGNNGTQPGGNVPCYNNGREVLQFYGFSEGIGPMVRNFVLLVVCIFLIRFMSFVALWLRAREKIK